MRTRLGLKEYVAGALVANAPAWLLSLMIPYFKAVTSIVYIILIIYFTTMAGGVAAGYLVARGMKSKQVQAGVTIGFFSYALFALFLIIIGVRGDIIEDLPSLTGFVVGGAVGARLFEKKAVI